MIAAVCRLSALAATTAALVTMPLAESQAASLFAKNFYLTGQNYDGALPLCDSVSVAGQVTSQFAQKERNYWHSDLSIVSWERVGETGYRPWGQSYIPRRFCEARVVTSDNVRRTVSYSIREDLGLIGFGWGVQWCVSGTDRNLAYAPDCRQARP